MATLRPLITGHSICEFSGLSGANTNPEVLIKEIIETSIYNKLSIVMFSDNVAYENGTTLANYIKQNKLGTIKETGKEKSLNTGSIINTWMWHLNKEKLKEWDKEIGIKHGSKECGATVSKKW